MRHCFFELDDGHEEFNFFGEHYQEDEVVFYSQHELGDCEMKDDYEAYFNP